MSCFMLFDLLARSCGTASLTSMETQLAKEKDDSGSVHVNSFAAQRFSFLVVTIVTLQYTMAVMDFYYMKTINAQENTQDNNATKQLGRLGNI